MTHLGPIQETEAPKPGCPKGPFPCYYGLGFHGNGDPIITYQHRAYLNSPAELVVAFKDILPNML
jgi:hypothetical protein